ncbi:hypothetical protein LWI28_013642 [Acer negundo]|uniref:NB-ARC domain-containing protein n=1 Tax=Acer negundo TaxID=4023 RepID=A0AAD5IEP7_ACENE|nr:hypothetical protein LWI28_013642 [Acer negundo]
MDAIAVISLVIKKLQGLLPADENTTSNDPAVFQKQVRKAINCLDSLKQFLKDEDDREASSGNSSMDDQEVAKLLRAFYSADDALNTLILKKELQEQTDIKSVTIRKSKRFMKDLISGKGMEKLNKEIGRLVEMKEKAATSDTRFSSVGYGGGRHSSSWQYRRARISDFCLEEETDVDKDIAVSSLRLVNDLLIRLVHQFPKVIAVVAELVEESTLSEEELMWRIIKLLNGASCLIVLEDVEKTQILESVLNPLCNSSQFDTRMILTTCNANMLPPHTGYLALHLGRLNEEESWKLFLNKVRMKEDEVVNSELKEKILKMCGGLPSVIVLLRGLLSTKGRQYDDWYRVIESANNNKGDILALSYQDLPPEIKPCFLYMGIFPKKVEIPVRRLIHLWVAEGFLMPLLDPEETNHEDMAGRCFEELVIRNMIQVVRRKSDGSPKTCYMPGVLYKAEAVGFFNRQFHTSSNKNPELAAVRWLATYSGIKNLRSSLFAHVHQNLRSYVAYDTRIRCLPSIETGMLLKKIISNRGFVLLNSLDLEGVYKPKLSDDLGKLLHLKYLGLRSTFIDFLPDTVSSLPCLETLDVKYTNIKKAVHMKAKKLRHVYLCVNSSNKVLVDLSSLTNLHTLWGLNVGSLSELTLLKKLTRLTKLKLTGDIELFRSKKTVECFAKLTNLQSLKLRSMSIKYDPFIFLDSLAEHHKLLKLYLLGLLRGKKLSDYIPPNLRKLTLSMSLLEEDPMPLLGDLLHLNVLRLLSNSIGVECRSLTCIAGGFPKLRVLKLWQPWLQGLWEPQQHLWLLEQQLRQQRHWLHCLQQWSQLRLVKQVRQQLKWVQQQLRQVQQQQQQQQEVQQQQLVLTVQKEAMPCLNELEIRNCSDMQAPQGLEYVNTLKEITLTNMPDTFREAVEKILLGRNVYINNNTCPSSPLKEYSYESEDEDHVGNEDDEDDEDDVEDDEDDDVEDNVDGDEDGEDEDHVGNEDVEDDEDDVEDDEDNVDGDKDGEGHGDREDNEDDSAS